jgi:hypothetical protein
MHRELLDILAVGVPAIKLRNGAPSVSSCLVSIMADRTLIGRKFE